MKSGPVEFAPGNLPPDSLLRRLMEAAERHRRLEKVVLGSLPEQLASHCRFVSYDEGTLCLNTDTSVMATQLRFAQGDILSRLREQEAFRFAWRLRVKVSPLKSRPREKSAPPKLSQENARLLKEEAGLTEDKGLRAVLDRLARHGGA